MKLQNVTHYVSLDIKTDGLGMGEHSLRALGMIAAPFAGDGEECWYSTFTPGQDLRVDSGTLRWWMMHAWPEWQALERNQRKLREALPEAAAWLGRRLGTGTVVVVNHAEWVVAWLNFAARRIGLRGFIEHHTPVVDLATLRYLPGYGHAENVCPHDAVSDARAQGRAARQFWAALCAQQSAGPAPGQPAPGIASGPALASPAPGLPGADAPAAAVNALRNSGAHAAVPTDSPGASCAWKPDTPPVPPGASTPLSSPALPYHLVPRVLWDAVARRFAEGAEKYGAEGWRHGLANPAYLRHRADHALAHLLEYINGNRGAESPEDNLAAVGWGVAVLLEAESEARKRRTGDGR